MPRALANGVIAASRPPDGATPRLGPFAAVVASFRYDDPVARRTKL
jgi:hypothetical protein